MARRERLPGLAPVAGASGELAEGRVRELFDLIVRGRGPSLGAEVRRRIGAKLLPVPGSEVEAVYRQAMLKSRHRPLRQLFAETARLLPRVKPCLLMSPMTVSQFLAGTGLTFDLVVFDEASQMPPEDAVASFWRGRQIIIAGDDQQLPPTDFFQARREAELPANAVATARPAPDAEPMASVLDDARRFLPTVRLRWHYRSRDESLIAFSNRHYYDDSLVTFPSPRPADPARGVGFHHVENGVYDRGGRRNNKIEAERVAALVFDELKQYPHRSVGVIALSRAQMFAVEDAIEKRRRKDGSFEAHFSEERREPVFVRNLETVQGDERDTIILSVGYAQDSRGKLSRNFGPLNRPGGEKRLNVAATRAREKMHVCCSFRAADLMAGHTAALGVRRLRDYLLFAETGELPDAADSGEGPPPPDASVPVLASIIAELRKAGLDARPPSRFGTSFLDLAVFDPANPGEALAGIRIDGPRQGMLGGTADREAVLPGVFEAGGWKLVTIRLLDWWRDRRGCLERLRNAIGRPLALPAGLPSVVVPAAVEPPTDEPFTLPGAVPYAVAELEVSPELLAVGLADPRHHALALEHLAQMIGVESPIHEEFLLRRLLKAWHIDRLADKWKELGATWFAQLSLAKPVYKSGEFWHANGRPVVVRTPDPENPATQRTPVRIAPEEWLAATEGVLRHALALPREALSRQVAHLFGLRLTDGLRPVLDAAFDELARRAWLDVDAAGRARWTGPSEVLS